MQTGYGNGAMAPDDPAQMICGACGRPAELVGDIEDTNGWRWFADGKGGLIPFCRRCEMPRDVRSLIGDTAPSTRPGLSIGIQSGLPSP